MVMVDCKQERKEENGRVASGQQTPLVATRKDNGVISDGDEKEALQQRHLRGDKFVLHHKEFFARHIASLSS